MKLGVMEFSTVPDGDTENCERTIQFQNTRSLTRYFEGIAGDQYLELIKQMVNPVKSFSSRDIGTITDRIEPIEQDPPRDT